LFGADVIVSKMFVHVTLTRTGTIVSGHENGAAVIVDVLTVKVPRPERVRKSTEPLVVPNEAWRPLGC
jgi:hypothetical protein